MLLPPHTPKKKALHFSKAWVQVPWVVSSTSFTSASPWTAASWARPGPLTFLRLLDLMSFLLPVSWPVTFSPSLACLEGSHLAVKTECKCFLLLAVSWRQPSTLGARLVAFFSEVSQHFPQSVSVPYMALYSYLQSCLLLSTHVNVCVCVCVYVFICLAHSRYKCLLRWC